MKRFWILATLLILTACAAAPTPSPSPTSTATLTPSPTATASPTKTPSPTPTATLPYEPLEGSTYREIARYDLKGQVEKNELSPDGSMLAVLTYDGVYLYDSDTLELRWRHQGRDIGIAASIAWTPNNELLFVPKDPPNYLLDPEDGSILEETNDALNKGHATPSPNGKYSFTYHVDRYECLIYTAHPRRLLFTLSGSYRSSFPRWMPDGEHIIFYPGEGSFEIWNVERGEIVQELENLYEWDRGWVSGFTPDEQYFVHTGSIYDAQQDQYLFRATAWNLSTGEPIPVDRLDGSPSDHGWQLNEHIIAFYNGMIIQVNESAAEMTTLHGSTFYTKAVYRRPDGLLVVLPDAILRYDDNFNLINSTIGHTTGFGNTNKALSPDGRLLAIGTATRFYVWDIGQNELVTAYTYLAGFVGGQAAWSPDSQTLAISNEVKRQVFLWDVHSRSIQKTIDLDYYICSTAWVDDSTLAFALSEERPEEDRGGCVMQFLAILDIETEQIIHREQQAAHYLDFISLYDQQHIAFHQWSDFGEDTVSTLEIWDSETNQRSHSIEIGKWSELYPLQHTPGVVIAELDLLQTIELETGKVHSTTLNREAKFPYTFYPLGGYILEYDYDNHKLNWYDLDGNLYASDEMSFEGFLHMEGPIITTDGRIFDIVNPGSKWNPDVALIELFPPE